MRTGWLLLAGLLLSTSAIVQAQDTALDCDRIKAKIRHIQSKMRAGYTRAQGEKMEAELRRLRTRSARACR